MTTKRPGRRGGAGGLVIAAATALLAFAVPGAQADESITITESQPLPTPLAGPCEVHFDSTGIGWVEELLADKIGRYNPATGDITEIPVPTPAALPSGEAIGADGGVWFTELAADKVARLDPGTEQVQEFPLPAAGALGPVKLPGVNLADAMEAGPDDAMWFTEPGINAIGRIDLATHAITSYPLPTPLAVPIIIHRGPGSTLVFSEAAGNKIGVIDAYTHQITEYPVPTPLAVPEGVTTGPDGAIWFTETVAGRIGRIDPVTHHVDEWSIAVPANLFSPRPGPLTFGSDGNAYVAEGQVAGTNVGQFNPTTHVYTDYPVPTPLASPCDVAAHGNSIYFGELTGNRVGRLTIGG